jgi:hypothetical protein
MNTTTLTIVHYIIMCSLLAGCMLIVIPSAVESIDSIANTAYMNPKVSSKMKSIGIGLFAISCTLVLILIALVTANIIH